MAGLFGLFGNKTKYVDEPDTRVPQPENKEAYFLESDDAKSFGNAEFMRKPNTIRRTFPKRPGGKGAEIIQEVSSMEKTRANSNGVVPIKSTESKPISNPEATVNPERRRSDSSMDMFRQMARDIKK
jgi:hypothetical protein